MFYCKECRRKNQWPKSMVKSLGTCEVCGQGAVCFDVPSNQLPERNQPMDLKGRPGPEPQQWEKEHGREYKVPPEIRAHPRLKDVSWHNEPCPSFEVQGLPLSINAEGIYVRVEHPDPEQRLAEAVLLGEYVTRYAIMKNSRDDFEDVLETDDLNLVLKWLEGVILMTPDIDITTAH